MAFFNKGQAQVNDSISGVIAPVVESVAENQLDLKQVEVNIHELAEKINIGKEKNAHLIQTQKLQLEQLQKEYTMLDGERSAAFGFLNGGGTRDPQILKQSAKRLEELNEKVTDLKRRIDRTELDILLLQQQKDEESINEILKEWSSYEQEVFQSHISPLFKEVAAAKQLYFEKLKQLRSHYVDVERLAVQINSSLGDADKVTVHTWFDATINSPELLITKSDEQKEEAITHSYLTE